MSTVSILDLKKGTKVILAGTFWHAVLEDNQTRQMTRVATVYGFETEMGSVYSHNITYAWVEDEWKEVIHTPAQTKLRERLSAMGW